MKKFTLLFTLLLNLSGYAPVVSAAEPQTNDSLNQLLSQAEIHDTTKINTLNTLSRELIKQADYDLATQQANDALILCDQILQSNNKQSSIINSKKATAYNNIGVIHKEKGDYDKALEFYFKSLKIKEEILEQAKQSGNPESIRERQKGIATSYNNIGIVSWSKGNYDKALEFYFKALKIFEEILEQAKRSENHESIREGQKGMAGSYNNIGLIHDDKGDYDKALEFYFKSLRLTEELNNKYGMALLYNNIGIIHDNKGDFDKALEFYFKSLKIKEEIEDKNGMAASYSNIGGIHWNKSDYDRALEFYFKSLKIFEELGNKNGMAASYNNIGISHKIKNDFDKALEFYFKSLKIKEEIGDKNGMANTYKNIGMLYTSQKKYSEAREYLNKGLAVSKEIGTKEYIKENYSGLSQLDSTLGNWKSAYHYHKLYSLYKDSIFNEESSKQIADMQTKYETDKKEKENQILRQENELRIFTEKEEKEKIERRDNMQYSIILIVVVALLSSILLLGKISVSPQVAEGLIFFVFLIFFEYILVLSDPYIDSVTGGAPGWKLLINSGIAALIFPLHSFFERLLKRRLTLKNGSNQ
jgi:tetratricopeptide (TPR) repeat protein